MNDGADMNGGKVVTRFAPSPTGLLHLGNVRTALLNWLFARKRDGRFLLRFEDTDRDRSERRCMEAIERDLRWLGLDWDGEARLQSARAGEHAGALERLAEAGHAYRCFCDASQLTLDRKLAAARGGPPRYAGRCRRLSPGEARRRAEGGEPFVWRLALSLRNDGARSGGAREDGGDEVVVRDLLRGEVRFNRRDLDDPVVVRSDGTFTFLLPNAVDDAADSVTHVLRGDDHLTNTAAQVWLLERLGLPAPAYLHHGLLLDADGGKLSKRKGGQTVAGLREAGLLPMALVQAMARLGHPNMPEDALDMASLIHHFEPERISTAAVRWSDDELWRWQARLLRAMPAGELAGMLARVLPGADAALASLIQPNLSRIEDAAAWARLLRADAPPQGEAWQAACAAGADFFRRALACWEALAAADWKAWAAAVREATGRSGKALFLPLRAALTGAAHGPEMSRVVDWLGRDGVRARLADMIERCEQTGGEGQS